MHQRDKRGRPGNGRRRRRRRRRRQPKHVGWQIRVLALTQFLHDFKQLLLHLLRVVRDFRNLGFGGVQLGDALGDLLSGARRDVLHSAEGHQARAFVRPQTADQGVEVDRARHQERLVLHNLFLVDHDLLVAGHHVATQNSHGGGALATRGFRGAFGVRRGSELLLDFARLFLVKRLRRDVRRLFLRGGGGEPGDVIGKRGDLGVAPGVFFRAGFLELVGFRERNDQGFLTDNARRAGVGGGFDVASQVSLCGVAGFDLA